ncbi:MAG TPA: hypothetical protein VLH75_19650 [Longimicrobiales bacterium]|nr:hypothetical protein [Longimicrobiales bacterium]
MTHRASARIVAVLALALAAVLPGRPLSAQAPGASEPAPPAKGVRFYPRAGLLDPDAYFYEYFQNFTGDGLTEWTTGYLGRAFVAGAGMEVRLGDSGAYLRGEVMRSFDAWMYVAHSVETLRDLFFPPEVVTTWLDVPATLTLASVQVVLPTKLELGPFKPYVLLGGGGKSYAFGAPTEATDVEPTYPNDGFTWGADVGAGLTFRFKGLHLDVQARDALTRYWGKNEHDILYTGALSVGLR